MIINGKRALAYIVVCGKVSPIDGADNIDLAEVGGWKVIIKKGEIAEGDKCVFFEIDSKLPEKEWSEFLRPKHFKVKTMKLGKFNVISQGLLLPLSAFPELGDVAVNTDVTETLGVVYSVVEDNYRKKANPNAKYASMGARHPKLFKTKPVRWLMRYKLGRKILFAIFGRKKDKPLEFPAFIKKTDEERVENQPWRVGDGKEYILTEKLDGTSSTYVLQRKKFGKFEFYVCSRNVRQMNENQKTYHDHNIYWDMAFKYNIEQHLKEYLQSHPDIEWVCIQGESVGSVQGNPLKLSEDDLYVFNFITSKSGRCGSLEGRDTVSGWGMKWVPILGVEKTQETMEELKAYADGKSAVNPSVAREGIVYRSVDGTDSFKNVSRKYLLKQKD